MSAASRGATSISKNEFSRMFRQCAPPTGFSHKIGVANSGGPDSTCLLFLIHRYLSEKRQDAISDRPNSVVSITVDHDLQPSSAAMTKHCSKFAQEIGAEHVTYKIPWSDPPFPPRPLPGEAFENTARNARFHALFQTMMRTDTGVVAFGHHSDDQVETCLMRLGRGTTELGAGGMKPCRRWGMGVGRDENSLGWAGYAGMKKWMIRPLLGVSKDRILATCDAHNLEYVTDTTNFQPDLTLRNALRHVIHGKPLWRPPPADIADKLSAIDAALSSRESLSVDLQCGIERLRSAVSFLTDNAADIDSKVDSALKRCMLPSPVGTVVFSSDGLTRIHDDLTRRAMILRVLRYVSFHPWGSIRADANRRGSSMNQIIHKLWEPDPFGARIRMFTAGGGVVWTPVSVRGDLIKMPDRRFTRVDGKFGWLASRQPPMRWSDSQVQELANPSRVNVTQQLANALKEWRDGAPPIIRILYDCRFLVHFNIEKIPGGLAERIVRGEGNIIINPHTRLYRPHVMAIWNDGTANVLHSEISKKRLDPNSTIEPKSSYDHRLDRNISSEWIEIEWIRSLSAL